MVNFLTATEAATGGMMSSGWSYYSFNGDSLERTKHGTRVVTGTNPSNYVTHYSINDNEVSEEDPVFNPVRPLYHLIILFVFERPNSLSPLLVR